MLVGVESAWISANNLYCGGPLNASKACADSSAGCGTVFTFLATPIDGISVPMILDLTQRWAYASGNIGLSESTFGYFFQFDLTTSGSQNELSTLAQNMAVTLANTETWNVTMTALMPILRAYNRGFERCIPDGNYSTCWNPTRTLQPSNTPSYATVPSTQVLSNGPQTTMITFKPLQAAIVVNSSICDCSANQSNLWASPWQQANNSYLAACLLYCDGPSFPYLLGNWQEDCLILGWCASWTGVEMDSLVQMQAVLSENEPSGTILGVEGLPIIGAAAIGTSATGALAGSLLAARLAVDMLHVRVVSRPSSPHLIPLPAPSATFLPRPSMFNPPTSSRLLLDALPMPLIRKSTAGRTCQSSSTSSLESSMAMSILSPRTATPTFTQTRYSLHSAKTSWQTTM